MALVGLLLLFLTAARVATQTCGDNLPAGHTANLSTVWSSSISQDVLRRSIPDNGDQKLSFVAGFYCVSPCDATLFAVYVTSGSGDPAVVWSANRDCPVQENATLTFAADGDLVLKDEDNSIVWSTGTSGQSVFGMTITDSGNLVLFDGYGVPVWESFQHPTDSLLPGQLLVEGMRLTPNTSTTNWTASDQFYLTVRPTGIYAFAGSGQPRPYYQYDVQSLDGNFTQFRPTCVTLLNGSLDISGSFPPPDNGWQAARQISLPPARSLQYLRFESDGHLRLYEWRGFPNQWFVALDVLGIDYCGYPTACGEYGICTRGNCSSDDFCSTGECSCPVASRNTSAPYFRQIDDTRPNLGCLLETPISCQSAQDHQLIEYPGVYHFSLPDVAAVRIDEESCKKACLRNCSCKAAVFAPYHVYLGTPYGNGEPYGNTCALLPQVLSLIANPSLPRMPLDYYNTSTVYLKVQVTHPLPPAKKRYNTLGYALGGATAALVVFAVIAVIVRWRRNQQRNDGDEYADLPGMPTRFTFETLKAATNDFSSKLGEGGFGSVFQGQLGNEIIAVKLLDRAVQREKDFLAEVQTIGSIHHINLVKLIGFCAEKSHRLLVYEYMPRGSLEKWIYYPHNNAPLDWCTRKRIVTDVARGLSYLHEECRQRIVHLDIKPHNILLDDSFNAKVSDFGLSKLIERDMSRVVTRMRGTPGYMAPEWLTSQITEKVDVYSFGVVVMEIISGRKNLDYSQPEESVQLTTLLQEKAKNDQLEDMIDINSDDMHLHKEEVIEVMKLAMWCLQSDGSRRPSMSLVLKVMEGERGVETNLDYNFFDLSPNISVPVGQLNPSAPPQASILSAPR